MPTGNDASAAPVSFFSLAGIADAFQSFSTIAGESANSFPPLRGAYQTYCYIWAGTGVPSALAQSDPNSFCAPYLAEDGRTFGEPEVPFTGGQCVAPYQLSWQNQPADGSPPQDSTIRYQPGPIGAPYQVAISPGLAEWRVSVDGGDQTRVLLGVTDEDTQVINFSVNREDGQPDDCGDLPPEFQPGDNYGGEDYDQPTNYTDGDGNDHSISVGAPRVNADGSISLPVNINGDEFDLGVPGLTAPDGQGAPGDSSAGAGIDPGDNQGETPVPEPPPGAVCIGVAVVVGNFPTDVGFVSGTEPNRRVYGVIGNMSLKLRADDGTEFYGQDYLLESERTFIPIPVEGLTCSAFRLQLNTGQALEVRPIYRQDEEIEIDDN